MQQTLDLPYEVAALYAIHQRFTDVARDMEKKTKQHWTTTRAKKCLVQYLREQVGIRAGPGRPPMGGFRVPQKPMLPNNSVL